MTKEYTDKEKYEILQDAAIIITDDIVYRVNYVPSWADIQEGEQIILEEEDSREPESVDFADIDFNEWLVYRLVLANP